MSKNNVVCLKCGKQFFFLYEKESELLGTKCPACGSNDIGELTYSDMFKNYGIYTGGG